MPIIASVNTLVIILARPDSKIPKLYMHARMHARTHIYTHAHADAHAHARTIAAAALAPPHKSDTTSSPAGGGMPLITKWTLQNRLDLRVHSFYKCHRRMLDVDAMHKRPHEVLLVWFWRPQNMRDQQVLRMRCADRR